MGAAREMRHLNGMTANKPGELDAVSFAVNHSW